MKKALLILLFILWINTTFADDISLISISDSVFTLHKIWTYMWTWYLANEINYVEDGWYFVSQWWQTYNYAWISQWTLMPWTPSTYNFNSMVQVETERFQYFLLKPYNYPTHTKSSEAYRTSTVSIYDKIQDAFYSNSFTHTSQHNKTPYMFFLGWQLIWKHYWDTVRYHLARDIEGVVSWIEVFDYTANIYPWQSQTLYIDSGSSTNRIKYTASENWNTLYYLYWQNLKWEIFYNDADIWLIRNTTTIALPSIPTNFNYSYTSTNLQNTILANWYIYCSMAVWYDFLTLAYDPATQQFATLWDYYMYHYNHYVWHGWLTTEQKAIDEQIKLSRFEPMKVWKYSTVDEVYKKFYIKTDNILYTNSTDYINNDELTWSWNIEDPTWDGTTDPIPETDLTNPTADTSSWIDFLTDPLWKIWGLFGWVGDSLDEAKEWKTWLENWTKDLINSFEDFWSWSWDSSIEYDKTPDINPQLQWIVDNMSKMDTWQNDFLTAWYNMLKIFIIWIIILILITFIIFYYSNH